MKPIKTHIFDAKSQLAFNGLFLWKRDTAMVEEKYQNLSDTGNGQPLTIKI